jgi:hypothetical protein
VIGGDSPRAFCCRGGVVGGVSPRAGAGIHSLSLCCVLVIYRAVRPTDWCAYGAGMQYDRCTTLFS